MRRFRSKSERGGGFCAHVPALDLTTEGRSLEEAKAMVRDAVAGYLEAAKLLGKPVPADVTVERAGNLGTLTK